jgi:hypothetical protein
VCGLGPVRRAPAFLSRFLWSCCAVGCPLIDATLVAQGAPGTPLAACGAPERQMSLFPTFQLLPGLTLPGLDGPKCPLCARTYSALLLNPETHCER